MEIALACLHSAMCFELATPVSEVQQQSVFQSPLPSALKLSFNFLPARYKYSFFM